MLNLEKLSFQCTIQFGQQYINNQNNLEINEKRTITVMITKIDMNLNPVDEPDPPDISCSKSYLSNS